ncbi:MAG: D-aminoacyl-tRNA deacylase [Desulfonauticus sp.]|nr:D-aminoacyl-tRNA deacylase [Desulfonauticus sp.]
MRFLVQRVKRAKVLVEKELVAGIGQGLLVLVGLSNDDEKLTDADLKKIVQKVLYLRIFADKEGKLNFNVMDVSGEVLLVSQFTLYADCRKGRRPNFGQTMPGKKAKMYFQQVAKIFRDCYPKVKTGRFGEDMEVELVNWGPVTIMLDSSEIL